MDNPYDRAYEVARSIQRSAEYQELKKLKQEIEENQTYRNMIQSYLEINREMQLLYLQGKEPTEELKKRAETLQLSVEGVPTLKKYIELQNRLTILMQDIERIIMEPLQLIWIKEEKK